MSSGSLPIDIDRLTEAELIELNHRIVARLRFMRELDAHTNMLEFRIGERVTFRPDGRASVTGMLTRYNKKTVTVVTDDGHRWNVAPQFLERISHVAAAETATGNVVSIQRRDKHFQ
jgi:hypothetical protein